MGLSIIYIILAGAILPYSGAAMQHLYKNQLMDIYSVGLGSAACFGGALFACFNLDVRIGAFLIATIVALIGAIATSFMSNKSFIVFGMIFGAFTGAIGTIAANNASPEALQEYYRWSSCSFIIPDIKYLWFTICFAVVGIALISVRRKPIRFLGLNLLTIATLAVVGFVGMISLVIPNLVKLKFPSWPLNKILLGSAVLGVSVCALAFLITKVFGFIYLPISALLNILVAPFMYLTIQYRQSS